VHVEYEWDEAKAAANFAKHGVSFSAAARALEDPRKIEVLDDRFNYTEERMQSLCMDRGKVLFVVTVHARRKYVPHRKRPEGNAT
jgi:uncharacterized protein